MSTLSGSLNVASPEYPDRKRETEELEKAEREFNEAIASGEKDFETLMLKAAGCAIRAHNCYWPLLSMDEYERCIPFIVKMEHYTKRALSFKKILEQKEGQSP